MDKRSSKKIKAKLENIDEVIKEIPSHKKIPYLFTIELAGAAAIHHNIYNGIEIMLKTNIHSRELHL